MTARTRMDLRSILALQQQSLFGKHDPGMRLTLSAILAGVVILFQVLMTILSGKSNSLGWAVCVIAAAAVLLLYYMALILPRLMYKNMGRMKDAVNRYSFGPNTMTIETDGADAYHATGELAYSAIQRVAETSEFFFLYTTSQSAFVIDKAKIEGGSYEELRSLLVDRPQTQYIACRY